MAAASAAATAAPTPAPPPPADAVATAAAAAALAGTPAMGDLFDTYNPKGADNGLFAPAYIPGFQPSEDAVAAYNAANHAVTPDLVNQLRMPALWQPPSQNLPAMGGGPYGEGRIPQSQTLGDPLGQVDPAALTAMSQGGPYDVDARRAAIAQRLAQNAAAQAAYVPPAVNPYGYYGSG
jgi:hypothetical protein